MFGIRIEAARPEQRDAIAHFLLDHFRVEEPISRSVHLSRNDAQHFFYELVDHGLEKRTSFVALNDENGIIGCRMNEIVDLDKKECEEDSSNGQKANCQHEKPESVKKISDFLDVLTKDVASLLPKGVKRIMKFIVVCVHPDYQRRGIAKALIDASTRLAVEQKCEYVCTGATAMRSQQLFEKKLGFDTLRTVHHSEYVDPVTKEPIFQCDDGTTCGKLMVKKLT